MALLRRCRSISRQVVADAIRQHYKPQGLLDIPDLGGISAVVSIDKMDTPLVSP